MRHRELGAAMATCLATSSTGLRVLDIGSGDGRMAALGLQSTPVRQYLALDASADALKRLLASPAPGNVPSQCQREVEQGDFLTTIQRQPSSSFDAVLCSYSLHHLRSDQKPLMLRQVHRVLAPTGQLIWIDSYLAQDETRERYLTRLGHFISADWHLLSPPERQDTLEHIWSSDFPESEQGMLSLLEQSHFACGKNVWRDDYFGMWVASKPASP